jgi:hypothetical protein
MVKLNIFSSDYNTVARREDRQADLANTPTDSNSSEPSWWDKELSKDEIRQNYCCLLFWFLSSIVIISTVASSYWYVSYDQYALRRDTYSGVQSHPTYEEGRYFLTLDNSLVYFPSTYQEVSFVGATFADNGLEFDLYITFYYRLPKESVVEIYNEFSTYYDSKIINNAKQVTKNVASTFTVDNFLQNRTYIEKTIAEALEPYLMDTIGVEAPKEYFKIINIVFPDSLIETSLETAIALQNNEIQLYQQSVDVIEADTEKMKASIDADTTRTLEYANNQAEQIISNSESIATKIGLVARSDGLERVFSALNITASEDKTRLTKVFAVMDNTNQYTMLNDIKSNIQLKV